VSEHLRWQLAQVVGEDGKTTRAAELARVLLDKAFAGDVPAIKLVLERLEGRPVPPLTGAADGPVHIQLQWPEAGPYAPPHLEDEP
jgi:hypothetical protein